MRYLFFLVLLFNVLLFFWEFQSGKVLSLISAKEPADKLQTLEKKQILLLAEVQPMEQGKLEKLEVEQQSINLAAVDKELSLAEQVSRKIEELILTESFSNSEMSEPQTLGLQLSVPSEEITSNETEPVRYDSHVLAYQNFQSETSDAVADATADSNEQNDADQASDSLQQYCVEIGPLDDAGKITQWHAELEFKTTHFSLTKRDVKTIASYLVYYPAAESFEKSRSNVEWFKQQGITDLWLFRKGEMKGAISLGLFKQQSRALKVQEKYLKQGIEVAVKARYKMLKLNFALLNWKISPAEMDKISADVQQKFPQTELLQLPDCTIHHSVDDR